VIDPITVRDIKNMLRLFCVMLLHIHVRCCVPLERDHSKTDIIAIVVSRVRRDRFVRLLIRHLPSVNLLTHTLKHLPSPIER